MTEFKCSLEALEAIKACGGYATYEAYDREIADRRKYPLFAPINWCAGWGNPVQHRQNVEKLAVFAAVKNGLVKVVEGGYEAT